MHPSNRNPALLVQNLSVRDTGRDRVVVDGASFELMPAEIVCLLGPSGSGKSTTALAMMGLLRPPLKAVGGKVVLSGQTLCLNDDKRLGEVRGRGLSMIFQDPFSSLNPVLTCGAQTEEPLKIHTKIGRKKRRDRILALYEEVGLAEPERIYRSLPVELSGGQLQRVMLAMATILEPAVLVADEPTTALDPDSQQGIIALLARMRKQRGMAILLITHDLELADRVSDRVLAMRDGRLMAEDDAVRSLEMGPIAKRTGPKDGVLLSVRRLSKTFMQRNLISGKRTRVRALDGVELELYREEIVGVFGTSGSGKTTLGRCIAGLTAPEDGEIILDGEPVLGGWHRKGPSPVQMVYQSPYASLNPTMRVGESIEEGPRALGMPQGQRRDVACRLLEQVGLSEAFYWRFPRELSGGERQRVVIARALAAKSKLLIADEPTASLDEHIGVQVLDLLKQLAREMGFGVLLISHDRKAITRIADRVMMLQGGKLVGIDEGDLGHQFTRGPKSNADYM